VPAAVAAAFRCQTYRLYLEGLTSKPQQLSELVLSLDEAYSKFLASQVSCCNILTLWLLWCHLLLTSSSSSELMLSLHEATFFAGQVRGTHIATCCVMLVNRKRDQILHYFREQHHSLSSTFCTCSYSICYRRVRLMSVISCCTTLEAWQAPALCQEQQQTQQQHCHTLLLLLLLQHQLLVALVFSAAWRKQPHKLKLQQQLVAVAAAALPLHTGFSILLNLR
jgi:hypothetical protein